MQNGDSTPHVLIYNNSNGIIDPLEFKTFPYLTTEKLVAEPDNALAVTKSFSAHNFVAPYKFMGLTALSEDKAITFLTFASIAAVITLFEPSILVFMHS